MDASVLVGSDNASPARAKQKVCPKLLLHDNMVIQSQGGSNCFSSGKKKKKYNQEQVSIHMLTFNREHLCNPEFTISSHMKIFQHSN